MEGMWRNRGGNMEESRREYGGITKGTWTAYYEIWKNMDEYGRNLEGIWTENSGYLDRIRMEYRWNVEEMWRACGGNTDGI